MKKRFILILVAVVAVTGCGKKASEKLTEKILEKTMSKDGLKADVKISGDKFSIDAVDEEGRKVTIKNKGDNVTLEDKEGKTVFATGDSVEVPAGFSKDIFLYQGAAVTTSVKTQEGYVLALRTKDQLSKVVDTYKAQMTSLGWEEESCLTMPQQTALVYKKANRMTNILILNNGEKSQITISTAELGDRR